MAQALGQGRDGSLTQHYLPSGQDPEAEGDCA